MKYISVLLQPLVAFVVFALVASSAYGQETQDAAPTGAASESESVRPTMPRLFFTNEQRRILEVVRQEFITEENLEFAEFAPLLIEQQETLEEEDSIGRNYDLSVVAYIRNRSSGGGVLWMNGEQYSLDDDSGVLGREGLDKLSLESNGAISGTDSVNNSRFVLKVGQKLAGDGEVNETYPVVIVKKQ